MTHYVGLDVSLKEQCCDLGTSSRLASLLVLNHLSNFVLITGPIRKVAGQRHTDAAFGAPPPA